MIVYRISFTLFYLIHVVSFFPSLIINLSLIHVLIFFFLIFISLSLFLLPNSICRIFFIFPLQILLPISTHYIFFAISSLGYRSFIIHPYIFVSTFLILFYLLLFLLSLFFIHQLIFLHLFFFQSIFKLFLILISSFFFFFLS